MNMKFNYKNKIRLFEKINNYTKCILCLDDKVLNINYICGQKVCISCNNPNNKCGIWNMEYVIYKTIFN